MILVGNKADLSATSRTVKHEEALAQADVWGIPYMETSAKTYSCVDEAFFKLLSDIHNKKLSQQKQQIGGKKNKKNKGKKKPKCCIF